MPTNKPSSNESGGKKRGRKKKSDAAPIQSPTQSPDSNDVNPDYLKAEKEAAELAAREAIVARIMALPPEQQIEAAMAIMSFVMDELDEEAIIALRKEIVESMAKDFGELSAFKTTIELIDGHLALRRIKKEMGPDSAVDDRSED